jgi:hypothetical protein
MEIQVTVIPGSIGAMPGTIRSTPFYLDEHTATSVLKQARQTAQEKAHAFGYALADDAEPTKISFDEGRNIHFTFTAEKTPNDSAA